MEDNEFSEVIATAQKKANEREAGATTRREGMIEAVKSRQEILHTVVHWTLLQAWRDLSAAGVKSSVTTGTNQRGDWQIALKIEGKSQAPALVFSVIMGVAPHLVCSRERQDLQEEVDYEIMDDATPVEIAQKVADYLSDTLG